MRGSRTNFPKKAGDLEPAEFKELELCEIAQAAVAGFRIHMVSAISRLERPGE